MPYMPPAARVGVEHDASAPASRGDSAVDDAEDEDGALSGAAAAAAAAPFRPSDDAH